jgi:hypothetical protein
MIGSRPLAHRRRAISFAVPGNSLAISSGCAISTVGPRFQRDGIIARAHDKAINLTFHLHALKGDRSLKETAMRMKPCAPWGTGRRES